jgi:pimeloyl-ACP methyl ester carboxylesterase
MESKKRYLEVADGSLLFYEIYGQGFPLFLLHGNNNDGTYFHYQIQSFMKEFQVFVLDSRGQGHSTNTARKISFQQMANDLNAIMEHENITRANILGFSDGANIAMVFAHTHPEKVNRMVLNAGNTKVTGLKNYWVILTYLQYFAYWFLAFFFERAREKRPIIGLMTHDIGLSQKDLTEITAPTLVIVGKQDDIKLKHTLMIVNHLPQAKFVLVPKQGHTLARKDANNFNQEVLSFLGGEEIEKN